MAGQVSFAGNCDFLSFAGDSCVKTLTIRGDVMNCCLENTIIIALRVTGRQA